MLYLNLNVVYEKHSAQLFFDLQRSVLVWWRSNVGLCPETAVTWVTAGSGQSPILDLQGVLHLSLEDVLAIITASGTQSGQVGSQITIDHVPFS